MGKVFEGLKVIDLTSALNGPFCTMFLADYGADVIKIEPVGGEQSRSWGPIDEETGESGFYAFVNRNKKGVTLNLKSEKGLQMFYDLVKDADVLVENYRGDQRSYLSIEDGNKRSLKALSNRYSYGLARCDFFPYARKYDYIGVYCHTY